MRKLLMLTVMALSLVANHAKADPFTTKYIRLSLAVLEFGDCYIKVEETSEPMSAADKFEGEKATLNRFSNAEILKSTDSRYRIIHSFDHSDPLEKIFPLKLNSDLDKVSGTLAFKTDKGVRAGATYWSRFKPPIIVCYDRLPITKTSGVITQLDAMHLGQLGVNMLRWNDGKLLLGVFWQDRDKDNNLVNRNQIQKPTEIDPAKGYHFNFRLPLPNARIDNVFEVQLNSWADNPVKSEIAHLLVQGCMNPIIGIYVAEKSSVVFISGTIIDGLADKTGLKEGDIILSINGQQPKTAADVSAKLDNVLVGDELTFKIKRHDEEQEIKVKAE